jgi:protein MBA1
MPETFVMPHGKALPSLISNFSGRWKLEKARFLQKTKDVLATGVIKYYYTRDAARASPIPLARFKHWFKFPLLQRRQIPKIAKTLYEEMYSSFARGNIDAMRPRLCENIYESLMGRVAARPTNTSLRWTLHRYVGAPKVVSHKFTPLSAGIKDKYKQSVLQQVVVRIKSVQSLQRLRKVRGRDGKVTEVLEEGSESKGKEVTEFFVIQRMMRKGVMGDWKIWGTTEEMTLEKFEKEERKKLGL